MYKLSIVNEVNGREYGSTWSSQSEKNEYLDKQIAKQGWGKNERTMLLQDVPAELQSRVISTQIKVEVDVDGNEVSVEYATVKADYVVTETNLNLSKTYRNKQKLIARKAEYKSIEEVLHIILDKGLDSPEYAALQAERAAIKLKHSLES